MFPSNTYFSNLIHLTSPDSFIKLPGNVNGYQEQMNELREINTRFHGRLKTLWQLNSDLLGQALQNAENFLARKPSFATAYLYLC